eukprot:CAMPEP_0181437902 /NCGR_PEP_ID=MMETSP1110-20121109/21625_1 /TAXON_ID=174948 /ORGANISM="Symbiodinium sp., Strain CCMP421" /LENGTH=621 /DNA_ID=CAMNT_0023561557 /DNA_START=42 /DNA_END=1907 /DNA_ORIENTATION=+
MAAERSPFELQAGAVRELDGESSRWQRGLCLGAISVLVFGSALLCQEGLVDTQVRQLAERSIEASFVNDGCCRFAHKFQGADWHDPEVQEEFLANALVAESRFYTEPGLSFDPDSGMTMDGIGLDLTTGEAVPDTRRQFSAASKEALHLSIIAVALQPLEDAKPELRKLLPLAYDTEKALDVLERKVKSLEDFDAEFPAFGGFLPWFCPRGINEQGNCKGADETFTSIAPMKAWSNSLPGLDNGQLAFGTAALVHVLEKRAGESSRFAKLAERWNGRLQRMKDSVVNLFYEGAGSGQVRSIATLRDVKVDAATSPGNAYNDAGYVLWDAFEGEMIVLFMDLLGDWKDYPNAEEEKAKIWRVKAQHVFPLGYAGPNNQTMVLQKGFWFSSHEQWKTLQMPYLDIPIVKHLFTNGEFARVSFSKKRGLNGLIASVNAPGGTTCDADSGRYCSALGIQTLAERPIFTDHVLTPYGAFPTILVDRAAGLAWYNHMLSMPRAQTPLGSIEAFTQDGQEVAPIVTWDSKATTALAMLGGSGDLVSAYMAKENVLEGFTSRVKNMYDAVFIPAIASTLSARESVRKRIQELPTLPLPDPPVLKNEAPLPPDFAHCGCDRRLTGFLSRP